MRQRAIGEKTISPKPSSHGGVNLLELIISKIKYKGTNTACFLLSFLVFTFDNHMQHIAEKISYSI